MEAVFSARIRALHQKAAFVTEATELRAVTMGVIAYG